MGGSFVIGAMFLTVIVNTFSGRLALSRGI
jgi:hypothetical protein